MSKIVLIEIQPALHCTILAKQDGATFNITWVTLSRSSYTLFVWICTNEKNYFLLALTKTIFFEEIMSKMCYLFLYIFYFRLKHAWLKTEVEIQDKILLQKLLLTFMDQLCIFMYCTYITYFTLLLHIFTNKFTQNLFVVTKHYFTTSYYIFYLFIQKGEYYFYILPKILYYYYHHQLKPELKVPKEAKKTFS